MTSTAISNSLYNIFDIQADEQIVTFYMGMFSKEGTENLLSNVRSVLEGQRDTIKVKSNVFKIAMELIQNVVKHCSNKEFEADVKNYFLIVRSHTNYKIKTGNCIFKSETYSVINKIETINRMKREELKQSYRSTLCKMDNNMIITGAGIGLMEVILNSSNSIEYKVTEVDAKTNFLVINSNYNIH
jgi:hypothetical protein